MSGASTPERLEGASRHLRTQDASEEQRATALELFFDLVFVFAITQLSHLLVTHLDAAGLAQTCFLLLVVWWAWIYTTWMTNWFDPDSLAVRSVLVVVMLTSMLMAIAIPEAFGDRGLLFAAAYVSLQVVRNAFIVLVTSTGTSLRDTGERILAWSVAAGALWLAGGVLSGGPRVAFWVAALIVDYAGPITRYWLPHGGRAEPLDWEIHSSHFAERFQLFVIIALGESIVVTGTTASDLEMTPSVIGAIVVAVTSSVALWWLYFDYVAPASQQRLDAASDSEVLARDAFTYLHIPIVAGIIASAVGDELVIAHPAERLDAMGVGVVTGGAAMYLLGHVAFRLRMTGTISWKRLVAAVAMAPTAAAGFALPGLATATLVLAVLVAVIVLETRSGLRFRAARTTA